MVWSVLGGLCHAQVLSVHCRTYGTYLSLVLLSAFPPLTSRCLTRLKGFALTSPVLLSRSQNTDPKSGLSKTVAPRYLPRASQGRVASPRRPVRKGPPHGRLGEASLPGQ